MDLADLKNTVQDGKIFTVEFIKRTDGTLRKMLARTGVNLTAGGERSYDPDQHNLLTVFDMQKRAYRSIPADSIRRIRAHGVERRFDIVKGRQLG